MDVNHKKCLLMIMYCWHLYVNAVMHMLLENIAQHRRRTRRSIMLLEANRSLDPQTIVKSGVGCTLLLEMDDNTFRRHLRLTRTQFEVFNEKLSNMGMAEAPISVGGRGRVPMEMKTAMFLWYMANQNSFREIGDRFNVSQSTVHDTIMQVLKHMIEFAPHYIKWPDHRDKQTSAGVFRRISDIDNVIGAIDGCHIRIQQPRGRHGIDYVNRKGYFSILLQGICNDMGKLIDVFIGPPGRVHDARMLRESDFFQDWPTKMENFYLMGDSAYIGNAFPFIVTPKRDNGRLSEHDKMQNTKISKARVIIENVFGRMKCRWRRIRDLQNVNIDVMVEIVLSACILHNLCMDPVCEDHPQGCPRDDDDNE